MKLLSLKLFFGFLFFLFFVRPTFAQQQYFFQEEFNEERPPQTLNPDKWVVYPNRNPQPDYLGCLVDTVRETGGLLLLKQCRTSYQFPYVVSKINPFPDGDFTASVNFRYLGAGALSTGVQFVDTAPGNGEGYTELFGIGFQEDRLNQQVFRIEYKDTVVFSRGEVGGFKIFEVRKEANIYKVYFGGQLVFTSPPTEDKVRAILLGTPAILPSPGYDWSWPMIDYIRVADNGPAVTIPQPFLELPWSYGKDHFKQVVFDPNSWFDHKYPLQNYDSGVLGVVKFTGKFEEDHYKSHSGYDYGARQGVVKDTPVLAAAAGKATFLPEAVTRGAGNMIKIDHGNGYQTWYEHLRKDKNDTPADHQLIVYEVGKSENVVKGQKIGLVGLSGNTTGYHIHLSVFKDINNNGNFDDDGLFGLLDPLGWEGDYTDPWEEYSSSDGSNHGAKSYKLFVESSAPKTQQVLPSGGTVVNDELTLNVPENASSATLNIKIEDGPFEKASATVKSIVPSLFLSASNTAGQIISNFNNSLGLIYDYSKADLSNINEDTISFYFFNPQTNLWEKIVGTLDKTNKTISAQTNHFSQFAVMAEVLDSTPPTTIAEIAGDEGNTKWYRSDATVKLLASDNAGGKGVDYTVYSLDGVSWNEYKDPLELKEEGTYKISFLSHDKVGNQEEIKTVEFSIDKTIPEAKIQVDQTDWDLKITPIANDQVAIIKKPGNKPNEATYVLTDPAGNTLTLETFDLDQEKIDLFKINSLQYNTEPKITLTENILDTNYIFFTPRRRPEIKVINQNFNLRNKATFVIVADAVKNLTNFNIIENRKFRKEEKPGIALLKLQTNKGKLEYTY